MGKDLKGKELGVGISQKKDGRYTGRFVNRFGRREEVCNRNLKALRAEYALRIAEDQKMSNVVDTTITVDEWFVKWMDTYKFNSIRANTVRIYKQVYYKHIAPILGSRQLNKVLHLEIAGIISDLAKRNYQSETQNKV